MNAVVGTTTELATMGGSIDFRNGFFGKILLLRFQLSTVRHISQGTITSSPAPIHVTASVFLRSSNCNVASALDFGSNEPFKDLLPIFQLHWGTVAEDHSDPCCRENPPEGIVNLSSERLFPSGPFSTG